MPASHPPAGLRGYWITAGLHRLEQLHCGRWNLGGTTKLASLRPCAVLNKGLLLIALALSLSCRVYHFLAAPGPRGE